MLLCPSPEPVAPPKRSVAAAFLSVLALLLCAASLAIVVRKDAQPGVAAEAPRDLPAELRAGGEGRLELLLFAHPRCPCTRATIAELERVLARASRPLRARAWFFADAELGDAWSNSDTLERASAIPGLEVALDRGGVIARELGVVTSGQVLVYAPTGALLYAGGLTPARGHEGESAGKDAVLALLAGDRANADAAPVFGCKIVPPPVEIGAAP